MRTGWTINTNTITKLREECTNCDSHFLCRTFIAKILLNVVLNTKSINNNYEEVGFDNIITLILADTTRIIILFVDKRKSIKIQYGGHFLNTASPDKSTKYLNTRCLALSTHSVPFWSGFLFYNQKNPIERHPLSATLGRTRLFYGG